jgi:hypothetical protein
MSKGQSIGTVVQIARYPVKSMAGEQLQEAPVGFQGITGDRWYAFVQAEARGLFPWLTGREYPGLVLHRASLTTAGGRPGVVVATPDGTDFPVDSESLLHRLEAASGKRCFLLGDHRGSYDVAHFSLITTATIARLCAEAGVAPDPARFRMNLVIETPGSEPFEELNWVGRTLQAGEAVRVAITEPDRRCAMVTIDPSSAEQEPAVLRAAASLNNATAGVYGSVVAPGTVRAGDQITFVR